MSKHKTRIMYIEYKGGALEGPARIGRVIFSKSMRSVYYGGKQFQKTGSGYKYNYLDVETGETYWISGPRRDGADRLYVGGAPVEIDDDVREEYWTEIRKKPQFRPRKTT